MSNPFTNWLQSRKFNAVLGKGNIQLAQELLEKKQRDGARLSLLEKVFRDKIQSEQSSKNYEREVLVLRSQTSQNLELIEQLTTTYKQIEQSIESTRNQLKDKEQEFILTQQKLKDLDRENGSLQKQLVTSTQEIEGLRNELKLKEQEFISIQQLAVRRQEKPILLNQISKPLINNLLLAQNKDFISLVKDKFKLNEINDKLLQCTGIDEEIFYDLEKNLTEYLKAEFKRYIAKEELKLNSKEFELDVAQESLKQDLKKTYENDISNSLKKGRDPEYNSDLTPHIYFMKYFLEGVYSAYLAWFLVYESKLLQTKVNILDIGAGSGAMIYGLFSLFKSVSNFTASSETHVSYCSLEQQNLLQHHGLEFWKQYIEKQNISAVNTYYRFKTIDLFTYGNNSSENRELPDNFFDFVVISHCIFANEEQRIKSHQVYRKIFSENLKKNGYVLIIVQGRRLFQAYSRYQTENQEQEERLVKDFINELGLKLEWYKYITSTGKRMPLAKNFNTFAKENLPPQPHMTTLLRQYLDQSHDSNYVLDDYVILARKE